jgi:MerR family transcriptional regulator, light-induced transcriptional regulator
MDLFTISDLEQFSGIKAHTIRIWEKRYNALTPHRSDGNTRYYDNTQLKRLLKIVSLTDMGHKVSEVCVLDEEGLNKLLEDALNKTMKEEEAYDYFIMQIISSGIEFNEAQFEKLFSNCILRFGLKETYINIIYPVLLRTGLLWIRDSLLPVQEHFFTNLIRQKLLAAIDALPPEKSSSESWLLFLPENEFHEIGLIFAHYLIRHAGKKVIYIGANVPLESLRHAVTAINPSHLLFFMVHNNMPEESQRYLDMLGKNFKDTRIFLSGNQKLIDQLKTVGNMKWIKKVSDLEEVISA